MISGSQHGLWRIISHRFVAVPLALVLIVLGWNVYVSLNANGLISGAVVDANGRPVAGATVTLYRLNFITEVESARTKTNGDGRFRFTSNHSHLIELQASTPALGASPRVSVRLWFRAQDRRLADPLRLSGSAHPA
ncbi:MAG: carboxypeptidase-like regulatory domain-containing protein [Acetobacteraceae bacterium]